MQQTETYQFNLIETGDTFSPAPLNDNAAKTEELFQAMATAIGLGGQTCRIAYGSIIGTGTGSLTLEFDFKPIVVFLTNPSNTSGNTSVATLLRPVGKNGVVTSVTWTDNSVKYTADSLYYNAAGATIYYCAIGIGSTV